MFILLFNHNCSWLMVLFILNFFQKVTDDLEKVNNALSLYEGKVKQSGDIVKEMRKKAEQFAKIAAEKAEETSQLGDRIQTDRSEASIQSEIDKIEKKLREEAGRLVSG